MKHIYMKPEENQPIYLLLHGTGGDENDLIPLVQMFNPSAGILSVRGEVNEQGMNRFFKRLSPGVFDLEDLEKRTADLYAFLIEAGKNYDFDVNELIAIGYSNGANIAASLLMHKGAVIQGAVLMHPMVPRRDIESADLSNLKVLITAGKRDAICPELESKELDVILSNAGTNVQLTWFPGGHEICKPEIETIKEWLKVF